jgi:hypothetical protein
MLSALRSKLTYANVMATTAVFIALGGSSYAALRVTGRDVPTDALTGADIKNLTGKDVKNKSLTKEDFRGSVRGPRGFQGPPGPAGAPGAQGPQGAAVATTLTVREGPLASPTSTASCNPGERAVGGGGITGDDRFPADANGGFLYHSAPGRFEHPWEPGQEGVGQTPTQWTAKAAYANNDDEFVAFGEPNNVQAYVICTAP